MTQLTIRLPYFYKPTFLILTFIIGFSCNKDQDPAIEMEAKPPTVITYKTPFAEGKLPFPQHNPEMSQQRVDKFINDLFIINNFGQYQCGDKVSGCYFHDGLDFVLPNGTPVYAVEDGTIRANIGGDEFYRSLAVEDIDEPGYGWTYTHLNDFKVTVGKKLMQGQEIGNVHFRGVEHLHLTRVKLKKGGSWSNFNDWINIFPNEYFDFKDKDGPIIKTPFLFFKNNQNVQFESGQLDTINGAVDIVVKIRDVGQYAHGIFSPGTQSYGDRLCIKNIDYRILKNGKELINKKSFNFSKLEFTANPNSSKEVALVFKHHLVIDPDHQQQDWNRFLSSYIITNIPSNYEGELDHSLAANNYWETTMLDSLDAPLYPNGLYEIEVTAYDGNDNKTMRTGQVYVQN